MREGALRLGLRGVPAAADGAADPDRLGVSEGSLSADVRGDSDNDRGRVKGGDRSRRPGDKRGGKHKPGGLVDYDEVLPPSGRPPGTRPWTWWRVACGRSMPPVGRAPSPASARRSAPTRRPTSSRSSSAPASARTTSTTAPGSATSSVFALFEVGSGAVSTTYGDVVNADVIITGSTRPPTTRWPSFFKQAPPLHQGHLRRPRASGRPSTPTSSCSSSPVGRGVLQRGDARDHPARAGRPGVHREPHVELRRAGPHGRRLPAGAGRPDHRRGRRPIRAVARTWGEAGAAVVYWGMGISQHTTGTDNARCLIALCSITGNVGRPGTGLHPLRGRTTYRAPRTPGWSPCSTPATRAWTSRRSGCGSRRPGVRPSTRSAG